MKLLPAALCLTLVACGAGVNSPGDRAPYRRTQRAYDGAPPVIPHAVRALQRQDCLTCHREGMVVPGQGLAPRTPHPELACCMQCHVEQVTARDGLAGNTFAGLRHPERGTRAYAGAPPTIPHPLASRSNCLGCHDAFGGSPLRTPHPDRVNCQQCHALSRPDVGTWRGNTFRGAP